jgi:hypothetical protein
VIERAERDFQRCCSLRVCRAAELRKKQCVALVRRKIPKGLRKLRVPFAPLKFGKRVYRPHVLSGHGISGFQGDSARPFSAYVTGFARDYGGKPRPEVVVRNAVLFAQRDHKGLLNRV